VGVNIAARVSEAAGDDEVLVSVRVRGLSTGSDLRFGDRGARKLKGLEGDRKTYPEANPYTG
jgi:class 3 adenylate cyclase